MPLAATLATAFNKPLLADSAGLVSFALDRIDGSMREMVTETVALAGSSVHFTPSAPLAPAARYQARVVGAMSALGDRMRTPFRWTFETYDPNPPAVTGTIPAAEAAGVARETVVQAIFDRPLRVGAQGAALTLAGPAGPVVAALRWVAADELLSFAAAHGMNRRPVAEFRRAGGAAADPAGGEHALFRDAAGGGEREWRADGRGVQLALYDPGRGVGG